MSAPGIRLLHFGRALSRLEDVLGFSACQKIRLYATHVFKDSNSHSRPPGKRYEPTQPPRVSSVRRHVTASGQLLRWASWIFRRQAGSRWSRIEIERRTPTTRRLPKRSIVHCQATRACFGGCFQNFASASNCASRRRVLKKRAAAGMVPRNETGNQIGERSGWRP